MGVVAIVQARLGSARFPRKALAELNGKPLIAHVIERVEQIRGIDDVILACPHFDGEEFQRVLPRTTVCSPLIPDNDVLGRYAIIAEYLKCETIMRVTGDCVLFDPRIAEQVLACYDRDPLAEYASNLGSSSYTDGIDCEVFSREALLWANRAATDPHDREHVTSWLRRNVRCVTLKTSIDTPEDLAFVRSLL